MERGMPKRSMTLAVQVAGRSWAAGLGEVQAHALPQALQNQRHMLAEALGVL
jgi:hypothetical protein